MIWQEGRRLQLSDICKTLLKFKRTPHSQVVRTLQQMERVRSQDTLQIPAYSNSVSGNAWVNRTTLIEFSHLLSSPPSLTASCLCTERDHQDYGHAG